MVLLLTHVPQTQTGWMELSSAQNFTQDDVDLNRLWYQHAAPAARGFKGHDSFSFSLSDLDNETPAQSFFISINRPPKGQRSHERPPDACTFVVLMVTSSREPQVTWCC